MNILGQTLNEGCAKLEIAIYVRSFALFYNESWFLPQGLQVLTNSLCIRLRCACVVAFQAGVHGEPLLHLELDLRFISRIRIHLPVPCGP